MKKMRKLAIYMYMYVQHRLNFTVTKMIRKLAPEERGKHQNRGNKCKCTTATDQCYNPPPLFL